MLLSFLATFAATYLAMVAFYFATGFAVTAWNRRNGARRIQADRDGEKRRGVEIRQSMKALAVSALLFAGGLFAQNQGWTPAPIEASWWSVPVFFVLVMVLFDAWFYFGHRLLHTKALYHYHAIHHRSVAPTVWSNDSSGLVDTLIEHGFYLIIWFVLPVPAVAMVALRVFDQVSGMIGHSGFEYFASPTARRPWPLICTTFHDLHHAQFRVNYGNFFSIWDRLCGTVHPDYDGMVARMEDGMPPAEATARRAN
ncbi:MAG: sterol desaturase family protein [Pseudomonadota bacterium]